MVYESAILLVACLESAELDPYLNLTAQDFGRMCETLAVAVEAHCCKGSRYKVAGIRVGEIGAGLACLACIASADTCMERAWACQSCDRTIEGDNLRNSVALLVFRSYHFQARDLFCEPHHGVVDGAPKKEVVGNSGQEEGPARGALCVLAHCLKENDRRVP